MSETIKKQVDQICEVLYNKKAVDIVSIPVADKTVVADWFVIASGRVPAQVKALCDELEEKTQEMGMTLRRKEGYAEGRWIVLDFADILVHLFYPEERKYYSIERLWDEHNTDAIHYSELRDAEA